MSAQEQTKRPVGMSLHVEDDDGNLVPMALAPVQIGRRKTIWMLCNGQPAQSVTWTFPNNVFFISDYQPTLGQANWVPPLPGPQNPIQIVPWFVPGPFQPNSTTVATITAVGTCPGGGGTGPATDNLSVTTPNITLVGNPQPGDGVTISTYEETPYLWYSGDTEFEFYMMIDGVNAGDQILQVQLAETYRSFQLLNGQTYVVASTNGQLYCDYPNSNPPTFYCDSGESTGQQMNMMFYDRPGQPMALVQDGAIAESCSVADAFYIFILYRSSTMPIDQYDPNNLWAPILCVTQWGWTATATVNITDWELQDRGYTPIQQLPPSPPVWSGAIADFLLQGQINVAEEVLREKRSQRARRLGLIPSPGG